jgi:hypothetical protein
MLAMAICIERYMKQEVLAAVCNTIKQDWLASWKERLGNPDNTP